MKYRYRKTGTVYEPQFSKDGKAWFGFKETEAHSFWVWVNKSLGSIHKYRDTKEIYFTSELEVNAFLGAVKFVNEDKITEFEHLN